MAEYDTYRVTSGFHYKSGVRFGPGDVVPLTDDEVQGNEFKLEAAPNQQPTAEGERIHVEETNVDGQTHRLTAESDVDALDEAEPAGDARERQGSAGSSTVDRGVSLETEADRTGENQTDTESITPETERQNNDEAPRVDYDESNVEQSSDPESVTPTQSDETQMTDNNTQNDVEMDRQQPNADEAQANANQQANAADNANDNAADNANDSAETNRVDAESQSEFDSESFVDANVDEIEQRIESGKADDNLDAVAQAEAQNKDRKTVEEAVEERRAELDSQNQTQED